MISVAINPTTLKDGSVNVFKEKINSPRITLDSSGVSVVHEYRCSTQVQTINNVISSYHNPDPGSFLAGAFWDRGSKHWLWQSPYILYQGLRLVSWEWSRSEQEDSWGSFTMTFSYPYGLDLDAYGEKWVYNFSSESIDIKNVNEPEDQITWEVGMDSWANKQKGIGVDGEEIHGTTVYRPSISLEVTKLFEEHPGETYLKNVSKFINHTNTKKFDIWEPYEVLFLGATISQNNDGRWQMQYSFLCGSVPEEDEIVVLADGTEVELFRHPWNYVWYEHIQMPVTEWAYVSAVSEEELAPPVEEEESDPPVEE